MDYLFHLRDYFYTLICSNPVFGALVLLLCSFFLFSSLILSFYCLPPCSHYSLILFFFSFGCFTVHSATAMASNDQQKKRYLHNGVFNWNVQAYG